MTDRRVALLRARAAANPNEAERLNAKADAAEAARAAGVSRWGSELPPLFLQMVLEQLEWRPAVCGAIRATCSTWGDTHDSWCRLLYLRRCTGVMEGKMPWFPSVTTVGMMDCKEGISGLLVELRSMPSLHTLNLPASCAERAVDAAALYGLTNLTKLGLDETRVDDDGELIAEAGEWVLDLSRLTTLSCLDLEWSCDRGVLTDVQVLQLSKLTRLTDLRLSRFNNVSVESLCAVSRLTALTSLNVSYCDNVTTEVLRSMSSLTSLTSLDISCCINVNVEGLRAVSGLTALASLDLGGCIKVTAEALREIISLTGLTTLNLASSFLSDDGLRTVSSLTALTSLSIGCCGKVTAEGLCEVSRFSSLTSLDICGCSDVNDMVLREVSSLTALISLDLTHCPNATAEAKQALRTALPNLTIVD